MFQLHLKNFRIRKWIRILSSLFNLQQLWFGFLLVKGCCVNFCVSIIRQSSLGKNLYVWKNKSWAIMNMPFTIKQDRAMQKESPQGFMGFSLKRANSRNCLPVLPVLGKTKSDKLQGLGDRVPN